LYPQGYRGTKLFPFPIPHPQCPWVRSWPVTRPPSAAQMGYWWAILRGDWAKFWAQSVNWSVTGTSAPNETIPRAKHLPCSRVFRARDFKLPPLTRINRLTRLPKTPRHSYKPEYQAQNTSCHPDSRIPAFDAIFGLCTGITLRCNCLAAWQLRKRQLKFH